MGTALRQKYVNMTVQNIVQCTRKHVNTYNVYAGPYSSWNSAKNPVNTVSLSYLFVRSGSLTLDDTSNFNINATYYDTLFVPSTTVKTGNLLLLYAYRTGASYYLQLNYSKTTLYLTHTKGDTLSNYYSGYIVVYGIV